MKKLFFSLPISLVFALGLNYFNHRSYYETIYKVQTIDLNMLASLLPTKLSLAINNNDREEIQRTINSNYGYFGIVITDCLKSTKECPLQNITAKSEPDKPGWKEKAKTNLLSSYPYDLLRSSLPTTAENEFKNARSTKTEPTGRINTGKIIGRVYYIRRDPINFWISQQEWIFQPIKAIQTFVTTGRIDRAWNTFYLFFDNGVNNYYVLTYGGGIFMGLFIGQLWESSGQKRKKLEQDINNLNKENKKLENTIKQLDEIREKLTNDIILLESSTEQPQKRLEEICKIVNKYEDENKIKEKELQETRIKLTKIQSELDLINQKHESQENKNITGELEYRKNLLLERETQLNQELERLESDIREYKIEIKLKEEELIQTRLKLANANSQLKDFKKQIRELLLQQNDNENLLKSKQNNESYISELKDLLQNTKDKLDEFESDKEELTSETIKELTAQIVKYEIDVACLNKHCKSLDNEIDAIISTSNLNLNRIVSFKSQGTEDIFNCKKTDDARKVCPELIWRMAGRKLGQVDSAKNLECLKIYPGNRLEKLAGDRKNQHSLRINEQYRICFIWSNSGAEQVEIVDYH